MYTQTYGEDPNAKNKRLSNSIENFFSCWLYVFVVAIVAILVASVLAMVFAIFAADNDGPGISSLSSSLSTIQSSLGSLNNIQNSLNALSTKVASITFPPAPAPPAPAPATSSNTLAGACNIIPPSGQRINADNLVLGSGIAGMYTAYRLIKNFGQDPTKLWIVDKHNRFGGRINDYCLDGGDVQNPNANPQMCHGGGPLRVNDAHALARGLATELGVELEWAMRPYIYHTDRDGEVDSIRPGTDRLGYPPVVSDPGVDPSICSTDLNFTDFAVIPVNGSRLDGFAALFWFIRAGQGDFSALLGSPVCPANLAIDPHNYPDYGSYSRALFGESVDQYMRSWLRFRSLTSPDHDADHLVDWTRQELIINGDGDFYPVGGWSQFIRKLTGYLQSAGVHFDLGDEVVCMNKGIAPTGYLPSVVTSSGKFFVAKQIFNSMPPLNMSDIQGTIMDSLNGMEEFTSIEAEKVITMSVWWNRRWWEPMRPESAWLNKIYFTTYFGGECFNTFEIYTTPYLYKQNVTRGIYDDGQCVEMWEKLINEGPSGVLKMKKLLVEALNRHIAVSNFTAQVGLLSVSDIANVRPLIRFPAWHLSKPDTNPTTCDVEEWAVQPIIGTPMHMMGEAYAPQTMGWNEGVMKSAVRAIKKAYPGAATTTAANQLLAVKVCQSNEYATYSANLLDIHSNHTRIPMSTARSTFIAQGWGSVWAHWGARCADPSIDGGTVDDGQWYNYYPSSCGKLTSVDPCHHADLYTSWVPDYGIFSYGPSWVPYGADPNPGCGPVVPASVASASNNANNDPPAHGGGL